METAKDKTSVSAASSDDEADFTDEGSTIIDGSKDESAVRADNATLSAKQKRLDEKSEILTTDEFGEGQISMIEGNTSCVTDDSSVLDSTKQLNESVEQMWFNCINMTTKDKESLENDMPIKKSNRNKHKKENIQR